MKTILKGLLWVSLACLIGAIVMLFVDSSSPLLAVFMTTMFLSLATVGLAPAIFGPWMNISGSTLANYWRRKSEKETVDEVLEPAIEPTT